jgi:hypothetical protein
MTTAQTTNPAIAKVLATITDDELAGSYPDRTHFIAADDPHQGEMATRALFSGDPVAIVYPDGHELLIHPDRAHGIGAALLGLAAFFIRRSSDRSADVLQLPPRARVEARDAGGHPIAA